MLYRISSSPAVLASFASVLGLISAAPATGQTSKPPPYSGITSGGPIASPDRIASDDSRKVVTSAQIGTEDDIVSANFALDLTITSSPKRTTEDGVNFNSTGLVNVSIKGSVPLNPAAEGSQIDFKNFGENGKLTVGINVYRAKMVAPGSTLPSIGIFAKVCIDRTGKQWLESRLSGTRADDERQISEVTRRYETEISAGIPTLAALSRAASIPTAADFGAQANAACKLGGTAGIGNELDYARVYGEAAIGKGPFAAWRKRYLSPQNSFFFGAEASIGYNRFSVADRTTVTVGVKDRVGFDINGRAGWVFGDAGMVLLASGGWTRSYKAKAEVEVCGPPDLSGNTTCIKGQDGLPDKSETAYATVSLRKVLLRNKDGQPIVGIRPSVTYVVEDKDWQFELPVYLQRSDTNGLDAGVRGIYNTGSKKFGLGAFVGVPF